MKRHLTPKLLAISALVFLCSYASMSVTAQELGAGLRTIRVVVVDRENKTVTYVPARPTIVDSQGRPKERFDAIPFGGTNVMLSGSVALRADPAEIAALRERAEAALGPGASIKELQPVHYRLWATSGEKQLFSLPASSGALRPVPVQTVITTPAAGAKVSATLYASVTYRETLAPAGIVVSVDWKKLIAELKTRQSGSRLTAKDIEAVARSARDTGSMKIDVIKGGGPLSFDLVLPYVEAAIERALQPQPPAATEEAETGTGGTPSDEGVHERAVSYSIKSEVESKTGVESISMNTAQSRHRSFVIVGNFPLYP